MKIFRSALILLVCSWSTAVAGTVELSKEKFGVDIPDSWNVTQQPVDSYQDTSVVILSAIDDRKASALEILVCNNPRGLMVDHPGLITNIKESISNLIAAKGGQVQFTGESKVNLNDVPAYLLQYTATLGGTHPMFARTYQIAANGKLYLISMRTVDATADGVLESIAHSLRFDTPPDLPKPPINHRTLKIALVVGAVAGGLVAFVVGIIIFRRRQQD
jgi:hypothetical protein